MTTYFENMTNDIFTRQAGISNKIETLVTELNNLVAGNPVNMRKYIADVDNLILYIRSEKVKIMEDILIIQAKFNTAVKDALKIGEQSVVDIFLYTNNNQVTSEQVKELRTKFRKMYGFSGDIVMKSDSIPILEMNSSLAAIQQFVKNLGQNKTNQEIQNLLTNHAIIRKASTDVTKHAQSVATTLFDTVARMTQLMRNGRLPKEVGPLIARLKGRLQGEGVSINRIIKTKVGESKSVPQVGNTGAATNQVGNMGAATNQLGNTGAATNQVGKLNETGNYMKIASGKWAKLGKLNDTGRYMQAINKNGRVTWVETGAQGNSNAVGPQGNSNAVGPQGNANAVVTVQPGNIKNGWVKTPNGFRELSQNRKAYYKNLNRKQAVPIKISNL